MIAKQWIMDAAICEMAMLSKMARGDDMEALAEMKMFVAKLDEAVKNPPDVTSPTALPAIVRDGYTVRTDEKSGFQVFEMHNTAAVPDAEEATPLSVFENLKPEQMHDVVVLMRDLKGQIAVTSNMTEPSDILLFMEILKSKMLNALSDGSCDTSSLDGA